MYAMVSNIILLYIAEISICGFHTICILSIVSIVTSSVYFLLSLLHFLCILSILTIVASYMLVSFLVIHYPL